MTIRHDWERHDAVGLAAIPRRDRDFVQRAGRDRADGAGVVPASLLSARPQPKAGMTLGKRLFDIVLALILLLPLSVVMMIVAVLLAIFEGRPVFYVSERMRAPGQPFRLIKFRTMSEVDEDAGATGAHKAWRITRLGWFLRRTRIDELPQLFNILCGDMSFVGPRPTIREYVDRYPTVYGQVLKSRPGVTGLATLIYHRHEDKILRRCKSAQATEAAYAGRCLPTKLKIDLIYQKNRTLGMDLWILWRTILVVVYKDERPRRHGRR